MSAIEPSLKPLVIRASAGTGKTFQLSTRYLALVAAGERPDRILATTFTRKAAAEIEERILRRLAEAALEEKSAESLGEQLGQALTCERCGELLADLLRDQHRLRVCTLDSLCLEIALGFGYELGLPPNWRVMDQSQDLEIREGCIEQMLARGDRAKVISLVRLLKSGHLGRSVHDLLVRDIMIWHGFYRETGPAAWNWLNAPKPLGEERLRSVIEGLEHAQLPSTAKGEPDKRWSSARDKIVALAKEKQWEELIGQGFAKKVLEGETAFCSKEIPEQLLEYSSELLREAGAALLDRIRWQTVGAYELLELFDSEYEASKLNAGVLSFTDVKQRLSGGAFLGDLEHVYYRLDTRLSHMLLDEFQDTSRAEFDVLQPLADEILNDCTRGRSFFCVGDVKQAIYGWRGGVAEIFDKLEERWPHISVSTMETSRRSGPQVMDLVNQVFLGIASNQTLEKHAAAAQRWARGFQSHSTVESGNLGHVQLCVSELPLEGENQEDAALRGAAQLVKRIASQAPGASIGVLTRRNRTVARMIYELTRDGTGLRVSEEGGSPLTDSPAVCAILALLRLAEHPGDLVARFHVASSPLGEILGLGGHSDRAGAMRLGASIRRRAARDGLGRMIWELVRELSPRADARDRGRLSQLVELGQAFRPSERLSSFVAHVESTRVEAPGSADIRVMTVHQSKGLEFDVVVLPELDQALIGSRADQILTERPSPLDRPIKLVRSPKELVRKLHPDLVSMHEARSDSIVAEALSLLYVALTRARHSVYMQVWATRGQKLSHAGILKAALLPESDKLEPGSTPYQAGDPEWARKVKLAKAPEGAVPAEIHQPAALAAGRARRRGFLRQTASVKLESSPFLSSASASRGTAMHALLEEIEWLDDSLPDPAILERLSALSRFPAEERRERVHEILRAIGRPGIREALSRASYRSWGADTLEVYRERPFAMLDGESVLAGVFDRLVVGRLGGRTIAAEILDFKSGSAPDQAALGVKRELYRPQIELYRRAASRMLQLEEAAIGAKLVFIESGAVEKL